MGVDAITSYDSSRNLPAPLRGAVGTYDFGNNVEAILLRWKVKAHTLIHYNLSDPDALLDCPYCNKLLEQ